MLFDLQSIWSCFQLKFILIERLECLYHVAYKNVKTWWQQADIHLNLWSNITEKQRLCFCFVLFSELVYQKLLWLGFVMTIYDYPWKVINVYFVAGVLFVFFWTLLTRLCIIVSFISGAITALWLLLCCRVVRMQPFLEYHRGLVASMSLILANIVW